MSHDLGSSQLEAALIPINNVMTAGRDINLNVSVNRNKESILNRLKASLNPVTSASYDSYEAKQRTECFPNTRVQILNEIDAWITGDAHHAPIYLLDGVAGIGKSTIAQTIAVKAASLGLLGATFFFSRDEDLRKIAKHFFPTIAFQLGCYDEKFAISISASLDKNPDAPTRRLYQQFALLILEPLRDMLSQKGKPTLIVVDALDECENEGAQELLSLLAQYAPQMSGLKMLITSRPEWHLRQVLDQEQNHEHFRLHDIEMSIVQSDIEIYLHARLSPEEFRRIFPNRRTPWHPSAQDMEMLCGICGTLFIIAATAAKFILQPQHIPQKQLSLLLKGVSPDDFTGSKHTNVLDETYLRIICATQSDMDEVDEDWFKDLNKILGALITLANPLSCDALASLLDMDVDEFEATLSNLHSLVAPTGDGEDRTFRIHHKSFPDFITNRERIQRALKGWKTMTPPDMDSLLWINTNSNHLQLAKACLRVMNNGLNWNMADINEADWYKDKEHIPHVAPGLISRDLEYASLHWASHLLRSPKIDVDVEVCDYLDEWSSSHILHWIEVMVVLNQVDRIYTMLQDAITSIKFNTTAAWSKKTNVEELLSDTSRFVQQTSEVMKVSPMHIYRSCMPFIPTETSLSRTYGPTAMLQIEIGRNTHWDPFLMTFVGHSRSVCSVALSADVLHLASGSRDKTIRLWDTKTGAHIQTLTGHTDPVLSVGFSSNGLKLVSGSKDKTIRLWDVKTGSHISTLTGHLGWVQSVAFSSDSLRLASGSSDKTVGVWNATTGDRIATMYGHSGIVNAIAFSKDDSRLASGSKDKTVRIWNTKDGAQSRIMTGHSGEVHSVVFSKCGSQLASGSSDKTIRLWDTKTGTQIYTCVGHSDMVLSVALSSDSSKIASGSFDKTIRLWDLKTGAHIVTFTGHSNPVFSIALSSDGSQLASGSSDDTVRLWDTSTNIHQPSEFTPARHSSLVTSITFSEDGSQLASGSRDSTVRVWNASTWKNIFVLSGHSERVTSVAFSNVDSQLASGSYDHTIRLWNARTGTQILTLTGHEKSVLSVAFSKDGSQLASGSGDKTIRIWNTVKGTQVSTIAGHYDLVRSVAFSSDGLRLASGSDDHIIRFWDTKTGALIHTLTSHSDRVQFVGFSPGGFQLASASKDKTVRLWDAETGTLRSTLAGTPFSLSELIWAVFLTCDDGVGPGPMSLLLLVRRETPRITGLVKASLHSGDKWEIGPLCWFPPDMEARRFAFNQVNHRVAVGCTNGQVMIIDLSSEMSRLS